MPLSKGYIINRLLWLVVVAFGVLTITFILTRVIPAHPELLWAGAHPTAEQIAKAREELKLNQPIYMQLYYYLLDFITGDWGVSWRTRQPVLTDIINYLPATLELVIAAFVIAILAGVPIGILAALKRNTWIDEAAKVLSTLGASVPVFWLAMILQLVLSNRLGLLPGAYRVSDYIVYETGFKQITGFMLLDSLLEGNIPVFLDALKHLIMPALVLGFYPFGLTVRMTRALMIETLNENYTRSALVWGIPKKLVMFKYSLKNVLAPLIASLGLSFGYTIIGAFMVELVFVWPGIGLYAAMSLLSYDYPAIIGCVVVVALFYSVINTIVDIIHAMIDPRVKF